MYSTVPGAVSRLSHGRPSATAAASVRASTLLPTALPPPSTDEPTAGNAPSTIHCTTGSGIASRSSSRMDFSSARCSRIARTSTPGGTGSARSHFAGSAGSSTIRTLAAPASVASLETFSAYLMPSASLSGQTTTARSASGVQSVSPA